MTDTDPRLHALRGEWTARHEAARTRRTTARLTAAEAAFRAYSRYLAAGVPAQRGAADARVGEQEPATG